MLRVEFGSGEAAAGEDGELGVAAVWFVFKGEGVRGALEAVDERCGGALRRALRASRFEGAREEMLEVLAPAQAGVGRIVLVGAGEPAEWDELAIEQAAARAYRAVSHSGARVLRIHVCGLDLRQAARAAFGACLAAYRFDKYRTREKPTQRPSVSAVELIGAPAASAEAAFAPLRTLAEAIYFTRDLVSEPANVLYPQEFARRVQELERLGLEVEVLGERQLRELKMGALLAVGQGSARESQLVVLQWRGAGDDQAPWAFVGKGVCFDSGGITLKAGAGMHSMIWDMAGAAAVAGLMYALAARKAKVNAVGVLALVENMPDGQAQRPGDIVTSSSGQTIEIISTDAEGRLILADALWYCQQRFHPSTLIDLATLTGGIALGPDYAQLYAPSDELARVLTDAGTQEGELLWRMPLDPRYESKVDCEHADMKNSGNEAGGSITAALMLQRFVTGCRWAHLDMAANAWKSPSNVPTIPDGATGFGVRLLNRVVDGNGLLAS